MLNSTRNEKIKIDFANPEKSKDIIDELIRRVCWCITSKRGYADAIYSTLKNLPTSKGLHNLTVKEILVAECVAFQAEFSIHEMNTNHKLECKYL